MFWQHSALTINKPSIRLEQYKCCRQLHVPQSFVTETKHTSGHMESADMNNTLPTCVILPRQSIIKSCHPLPDTSAVLTLNSQQTTQLSHANEHSKSKLYVVKLTASAAFENAKGGQQTACVSGSLPPLRRTNNAIPQFPDWVNITNCHSTTRLDHSAVPKLGDASSIQHG